MLARLAGGKSQLSSARKPGRFLGGFRFVIRPQIPSFAVISDCTDIQISRSTNDWSLTRTSVRVPDEVSAEQYHSVALLQAGMVIDIHQAPGSTTITCNSRQQ